MNGYPSYINNKEDVLNLLDIDAKRTRAYLQELLDTKDVWLMTRKLEAGEQGIEDETHKVVVNDDPETKDIIERYQYEFMEDPNGPIFRLGFTVDEVRALTQ